MTPAQFATHVRRNTNTTSVTFTDAEMLLSMEVHQLEFERKILKADERILEVPMTTDLVADQREYPLDGDIVAGITRVEAILDGTNLLKLDEKQVGNVDTPIGSETQITAAFQNSLGRAFYILRRRSIFLLSGSITGVTDGLLAWVNTELAPVTDLSSAIDLSVDPSATTHGMPRSLHELWARAVIIEYKSNRDKPIPLTEKELSFDDDMAEALEILKKGNKDRNISSPEIRDERTWNNGYDL